MFLFLSLICFSCQQKNDFQKNILTFEYDLYRFIINQIDDSTEYNFIAIADSTLRTDPVLEKKGTYRSLRPGSYTPRIFNVLSNVWTDFKSDQFQHFFESTNLQSYKLAIESLHVSERIRLCNWQTVRGSNDSVFGEKNRHLFVWFSRVAIDQSKTEALLYVEYICSPVCGEGRRYWLKKRDAIWKIHKSHGTWVS